MWKENHLQVINEFLESINKDTDQFILKGGTALLTCYQLDRFSEDIDFDSRSKQNIISLIDQFSKQNGYSYRVGKDTNTVKRTFIDYGNAEHKLKVETSYRQKKIIDEEDYTRINGISVYTIDRLFQQKCDAYLGRDRIRDIYDLCYIYENYSNELSKNSIKRLQQAFTYKGINEINALILEQSDELVDADELFYKFLYISEKIGLEKDDNISTPNQDLSNALNELNQQGSFYDQDNLER